LAVAFVQASDPNGLFSSPVGSSSTVYLVGIAYNGGNAISSSAPTMGGSAVTATMAWDGNSPLPTSALVYAAVWPLLQGSGIAGGTQLGLSFSATGGATQQTLIGLEFTGLGTSPVLDGAAVTGKGSASGPADSGATAAVTGSLGVAIGVSVGYALTMSAPGSPWTGVAGNSSFCYAGYSVYSASGASYDFSTAYSGTGNWVAGAMAFTPSGVAAPTPRPLVVPSLAAIQAATW
jgi:hypothetical protein